MARAARRPHRCAAPVSADPAAHPTRLPIRPGRPWQRLPVASAAPFAPQALSAEELEKAKARANRFGVPVKAEERAAQNAEQQEKKLKRADRFATGTAAAAAPVDPEEAERQAKRAARFGVAA